MKILFIIILFIPQLILASSIKKNPFPGIQSCPENTVQMIKDCEAFKCRFNVGLEGVDKELEVKGFDKDLCLFNNNIHVNTKDYPAMSIKLACKLDESGRLEMSEQFKKFKEGDLAIYANSQSSKTISTQCKVIH